MGIWGNKGVYNLIALVGPWLIMVIYGEARLAPTWLHNPPPFLRHLELLQMLPMFPALLVTYVPGRIQSALKHPMLITVKTWVPAYLLVNGAYRSLING